MAMIDRSHVEWRVIARLHELLDQPPEAEHDVTLTYALFSSVICWTCQRLRDTTNEGMHQGLWSKFGEELAFAPPWSVDQLKPRMTKMGAACLATLPASLFMIGLRDAIAHGDHRKVVPYHTARRGPDQELLGFEVTTCFQDRGEWSLALTKPEMRRIGLLISERFVQTLGADSRADALRHVLG